MTDQPLRIPFNLPEWRGTPVKIQAFWTLTKGRRKVTCVLWSHPVGAEMRLDVDGEMTQTKASRDLGELLDASDEWRKAFHEKGWTA
jgi:hypothetical protein